MSILSRVRARPLGTFLFLAALIAVVAYLVLRFKPQSAELVTAKRGPIVEGVYGIGTVTSNKQFHGRIAQATGIREIFVHEGDYVKRGARLISLQEGEGFNAPFDGTVTSMPYFTKETVLAGTIIITLQDLNDLHILATLEQQGALRVKPGQNVRLNFESLRHQTFSGTVRTIYPQESQFLVDITIGKIPQSILPFMTADVAIEITKRDNALLVPLRAISAGKVIVIHAGKQKKIDITVGATDGEWAEVLNGEFDIQDQLLVPKL